MLSEYEAAMLTRLRASGNGCLPDRIVTRNSRIGAAFLVLSLLSADGLLNWTASGRAEYERPDQAAGTETAGKNLCATRDARFLLQLDRHRDQGNVPGEILYGTYLTMLRARNACAAGRQNEGLNLYDSVFGSLQASEVP